MKKPELYENGLTLMHNFCEVNSIEAPVVIAEPVSFGTCAYYRNYTTRIELKKCAHIGTGGASWSYPGYAIDRTPYGVLQHELGHHMEHLSDGHSYCKTGLAYSVFSESDEEEKLTNYCPNVNEWFAEHFRLFVTNPDLLRMMRPKTYTAIAARLQPVELRKWSQVLENAPLRTIRMAAKKAGVVSFI